MIDEKDFLDGFLKYLQSYYGAGGRRPSTVYSNTPRMPVFQSGQAPELPEEVEQADMGMMPDYQMDDFSIAPMGGGGDMADELNGMFPPRDPRGLN